MNSPVPLPRLCFVDTGTLLSMAVDERIAEVVAAEIGGDTVVVIDVVTDELRRRATISDTASLAKAALVALEGKPSEWVEFNTRDSDIPLELIRQAQEDVADGRVLIDDLQHWAESTIIAMGRQSAASGKSIKVLLSEDYDARRVAAGVKNMDALSIHRILHRRVHAQEMTAETAAELAGKLHHLHRGPDVTAEDFTDPTGRRLGRVGHPLT